MTALPTNPHVTLAQHRALTMLTTEYPGIVTSLFPAGFMPPAEKGPLSVSLIHEDQIDGDLAINEDGTIDVVYDPYDAVDRVLKDGAFTPVTDPEASDYNTWVVAE